MADLSRRSFLRVAGAAAGGTAALAAFPETLARALGTPAHDAHRSIRDVEHIVILMQENRSFDHYFGTMRGVRGFGDRFPIPLESGLDMFHQSDGTNVIPPYPIKTVDNWALINDCPHNISDMQATWNQGKFGQWPLYKTEYSMGHYQRDELPFQFALAEAFTLADNYHCSVATGTDPNRIMFFSGANFDPRQRAAGINCTDADSEPRNLRCWPTGTMPSPGYTYKGSALSWDTIPDVLEQNGIPWRIYQDPNNNYDGAMNGCLAFESFRTAAPESSIYRNGLSLWTLDDLAADVANNRLPAVSWVLPSQLESEHPAGPSSPARGADFTHQVLQAVVANPDVWSKTVFLISFDENDGLFDHLPLPAVPSYNLDGTLAGKSTIDVAGMYFDDVQGTTPVFDPVATQFTGTPVSEPYLDPRDTISGNVRPWGMGPRVPLYIISPWSRGGWVSSELFDHTSVGQFIEKRFGIHLPAITPWHRCVSGDLTSAFDFRHPNDARFPKLPDTSGFAAIEAASKQRAVAAPPATPALLFQESGVRYSRALPYELSVDADARHRGELHLTFRNSGSKGAVFHVYDKRHLDRIPRRYTVEAGKSLADVWATREDHGAYELWVYGINGYVRTFTGTGNTPGLEVRVRHRGRARTLSISLANPTRESLSGTISANAYRHRGERPQSFSVRPGQTVDHQWDVGPAGNWYDLTVTAGSLDRRFAGRVETGRDGISDPAFSTGTAT